MIPPAEVHDELLELALRSGRAHARLWEPATARVVLGRSNDPARECDLAACRRLGVPVTRRRGGGGAVVLAPGMLVVTLAGPHGPGPGRLGLVARVGAFLVEALGELGVAGLEPRGDGDLARGERKLLGCSIAFRRGHVLYQGCLLVEPELDLIERCLHHPGREPAWRAGRAHGAFLTTLAREGWLRGVEPLRAELAARLDPERLGRLLRGTEPMESTRMEVA